MTFLDLGQAPGDGGLGGKIADDQAVIIDVIDLDPGDVQPFPFVGQARADITEGKALARGSQVDGVGMDCTFAPRLLDDVDDLDEAHRCCRCQRWQ